MGVRPGQARVKGRLWGEGEWVGGIRSQYMVRV